MSNKGIEMIDDEDILKYRADAQLIRDLYIKLAALKEENERLKARVAELERRG